MSEHKFRTAWVFPGVGVKPCGQESAIARHFDEAFAQRLVLTQQLSGRDLGSYLNEPLDVFPNGLDEQLLSYTFACALAASLTHTGHCPDILAGNSFGVYPALQVAGALSYQDGLHILTRAYFHMEQAAGSLNCALCAVVGMAKAEGQSIIDQLGLESLIRINSNNDTCHIYSGFREQLECFAAMCLDAGVISAAILPLALPYHHPSLTADVREAFFSEVRALDWRPTRLPLLSTIDFREMRTTEELSDFVANQIFQPIDWAGTVSSLYDLGVADFYECGLGISLTQNARFIEGSAKWQNCKTLARKLVGNE